MEKCRPAQPQPKGGTLQHIVTPLQAEEWQAALVDHPDRDVVAFLLRGTEGGFRIGLNYASHHCHPFRCNMRGTNVKASVVEEYLGKEVRLGHTP